MNVVVELINKLTPPPKHNLTKEELVNGFCNLSTRVGRERFANEKPTDCFCGDNSMTCSEYRFDSEIFDFIESAVTKELVRHKKQNNGKE